MHIWSCPIKLKENVCTIHPPKNYQSNATFFFWIQEGECGIPANKFYFNMIEFWLIILKYFNLKYHCINKPKTKKLRSILQLCIIIKNNFIFSVFDAIEVSLKLNFIRHSVVIIHRQSSLFFMCQSSAAIRMVITVYQQIQRMYCRSKFYGNFPYSNSCTKKRIN